MEGQAVSDWEKSLVTCMDWCKSWFSRSSCKDHTSQDQGSGVGGPGASLPSLGPLTECPGALLKSGEPRVEMPACWMVGFQCLQQVRGAGPPPAWHPSRANLTPGLPWEQGEWQDPACAPWQPGGLRTGTFLKCMQIYILDRHTGQQRRAACPERWQRCAFKLMHSH